jgi:hypothetical protein
LCAWQRILQFSTVDFPPFPRGTTWSTSSRTSEPQTPPEASGHVHFPPSLFFTSRFTFGGTRARRFSCWAMSSSSAEVSNCSSVAPGFRCDSPALAFLSRATNSGVTVMWILLATCDRGSTTVPGTSCTRIVLSGLVRSRPTGWTTRRAAPAGDGTAVTTVLVGPCSTGRSSATSCFASWREHPKNRGRTSARFSSVITFASSLTVVMHNRPSRIGPSTSGNRRTSRAPTCR